MKHKLSRLGRLWFPKRNDHTAWMLMNIVGRWWLLLHGWKREYTICSTERCIIADFAHPRLMLVVEADGERFHMDIVKEVERNEVLADLGWSVKHFRYPRLNQQPGAVRREVKHWYWYARITYLYRYLVRKLG